MELRRSKPGKPKEEIINLYSDYFLLPDAKTAYMACAGSLKYPAGGNPKMLNFIGTTKDDTNYANNGI